MTGLGVAGYVAISDDYFPFSDPLRRADLEIDESPQRAEYIVRFHDDDDAEMATATIEVRRYAENFHELRANIVHGPNTQIDSLLLTFSLNGTTDGLALRTPGGYPWPPIEYHVAEDGRSVLVGTSDLGVQGQGSVTLDFLLDHAGPSRGDEIGIGIVFEMHDDGLLKLTRYRAETSIDVRLPANDQSSAHARNTTIT